MTKSRDLGDLAQTVAVNLPTSLGTAGQTLVVDSGGTALEFGAASGGSMTVYNDINGTDGTPSGYTYLTNASSPSNGDLAFVTANNTVYVRAASGWRKIATVQEAPSTVTGHSASYPNIGANATTDITLSTTDPEGFDVTWSYVVGGNGTLSGSNINNSNGDTLASIAVQTANSNSGGTNTITYRITRETTSISGDFTITFTATDSQSTGTSDTGAISFEVAFIIADSHYTSLLMATDGSAGTNQDDITDAAGNHTDNITVGGDTYAGTFSPYRHGGYSAYMGGNGNYISTPHAASLKPSGTDDFCVSLWYYPNATPSTNTQIAGDFRVITWSTSCDGWDILHLTSDLLAVRWGYPNYADMNSGSTTLNLGEWNHIVYCKNDSTMSLFLNGTRVNTTTSNIGMTASTLGSFYIGYGGSASGSTMHSINGYITDFKLDIGGNNAFDATATSITVPTERVTRGDNTKLFACHLPYLKDGSTSDHTLSFVGSSTGIKPLAPYDYGEYSDNTNGGSLYLDGSDYLDVSGGTSLDLDSTAWTIEGWVYRTGTGSIQTLVNTAPPHTTLIISLNRSGTGNTQVYTGNGSSWAGAPAIDSGSNYPLLANQWSHVAVVKSGTTLYLYHNGKQAGSTTSLPSGFTGNFRIGAYESSGAQGEYLNGYVSDFRVAKEAVYTGEFTPPSGPLTTTGGTYSSTTNVDTSITAELLLSGTDAHVLDKAQGNNLKLVGTAASTSALTSGSTPPYIGAAWANTSAVSFDGDSDYVILPQISLGSGDFTIEAYTYLDARLTSYPAIFSNYNSFAAGALGLFAGHGSSTTTNYQVAHNGTGFPAINGGPITYDQWVHLCLERYNGTITLYKDGSSVNSFASTATLNGVGSNFYIGTTGDNISSGYLNGWIQDFRVTVGNARYQGAFTKPAAPLKG